MREEIVACDICGALLMPTHDAMPWSADMQFKSVRITFVCDGKDANYDVCPPCMKRMKRYLNREAKKRRGEENDAD